MKNAPFYTLLVAVLVIGLQYYTITRLEIRVADNRSEVDTYIRKLKAERDAEVAQLERRVEELEGGHASAK